MTAPSRRVKPRPPSTMKIVMAQAAIKTGPSKTTMAGGNASGPTMTAVSKIPRVLNKMLPGTEMTRIGQLFGRRRPEHCTFPRA